MGVRTRLTTTNSIVVVDKLTGHMGLHGLDLNVLCWFELRISSFSFS